MANLFINIPVPPANGSGAPVDVSAMGPSKTISVTGLFVAFVTVEISNELVPTMWAPLITFGNPDGIVLDVACHWMRVSVAGYKSGAPQCDVGSTDDGTMFASLPVPAGNGAGAAVNTALLPLFKTITVGGPFGGTVQIEVSEDGNTNWSQLGFGFPNAGQQSQTMAAQWMRAVRAGVPQIAPGLPIVDVGACATGGGAIGPPGPPGPVGPPGPAGDALPQIIVYRPGAPTSEPYYQTWAEVETAVNDVEGACQLWVDQTGIVGYAQVPATANLDGRGRLEIVGKGPSGEAGLTFADGAQIRNVQTFRTIVLRGQGSVTPPLLWDLDGMICELYDATFLFAAVAVQPVMQVSVPSYITFFFTHSSELRNGNNPGAAVMNINAPALVFFCIDTLFFPSSFDGKISGAVGSTLEIQTDASLPPTFALPAFLGTLTVTNIDLLVRNTQSLPEQWAVVDVPAATGPTVMSAQVSTNFDDLKMMRGGSIVGISTRLTEAVTAGQVEAEVSKNGVLVGVAGRVTMGIGSTGGQTTALPNVIPYVAGDLIGIKFTSSVGFTPTTTDLEAWLEVVEDWAL